jgi:hypothetical protein
VFAFLEVDQQAYSDNSHIFLKFYRLSKSYSMQCCYWVCWGSGTISYKGERNDFFSRGQISLFLSRALSALIPRHILFSHGCSFTD